MKKSITTLIYLIVITLLFAATVDTVLSAEGLHEEKTFAPSVEASTSGNILDKAVFFGDSTTYGLFRYNVNNRGEHGRNYRTLKKSQIWVPKDGTFYLGNLTSASVALADGRNLSLAAACAEFRPEVLIITVGINGLCSWNQQSFSKYYEKMIDVFTNASHETRIILQSVYPTAKNRSADLAAFTNDKVDRLNRWIREIASKRKLQYLDTNAALKDENGDLRQEYQNGDGLHLNTQGFNAVLSYIEKHAIY